MKIITSVENTQIKELCYLNSNKGIKECKKFLAEGLKVIKTLLSSGLTLDKIYCLEEHLIEVNEFVEDSKICLINQKILNKISNVFSPSGIISVFQIPESPKLEHLTSGIVLNNIQDPGNMGTLIRTAAALGIKSVVCINGCNPWSFKAIQSTSGNIGYVNIFQTSWENLIKNKNNFKLYAMVVNNGEKLKNIDSDNALIVIGNEANGLSEKEISECDSTITLPMRPEVESLNAAIAGSIAMYTIFKN